MKFRTYLMTAVAAIFAAGCAQPEYPEISEESSNIMTMVVTGSTADDTTYPYSANIDIETGNVYIQVPYYLSDTEPIQAKLDSMKIKASLPQGCRFEPSLTGIHNLIEGYKSTLIYPNGKKEVYTFYAEYFKSDAAMLTRMKFEDVEILENISIVQPEEGQEKGTITVPRNDDTMAALERVLVTCSPWSTIESEAWNEAEGIFNLGMGKDITIISQSGNVRTTYEVKFKDPVRIDHGVGQIYCLWGWQATDSDPHGFTYSDNRTLAVVGKYLIVSNAYDYTQMPVYNRMTGEYLGNNLVNTSGIDADDIIHAITQDDAGHMVATTYVCDMQNNPYYHPTKSMQVRIYVWANGIENAPTKIFDEPFLGPIFDKAPVGANFATQDCFHVIDVCGDILNGEAVLTSSSRANSRLVLMFFKDGEFVGKDGNKKAEAPWHSLFGTYYRVWVSTKVVAMDPQAKEFFHQAANSNHDICYSNNLVGMHFDVPTSHWWAKSGSTNPIRGMDVVDFNGTRILAIQNALTSYENGKVAQFPVETARTESNTYTQRLAVRTYVADISLEPYASALNDGFLFDTRQGHSVDGDIPGTGYGPTGMTASYSFTSGSVVGSNWPEAGDVLLYKDPYGNSVQMYCLTPGQGLIAYNLTNLEP